MKKASLGALTAIALLATVSGCSTNIANAGGGTEITVGVLPSIESAPLFLGVEEGFFAAQGINLRIESFASGTGALIKPVVDGNYDIAVSDMISLLDAYDNGDDIRLLSPAGSVSADIESDFGAVIVAGDSPIQSITDLGTKVVGSNSTLDTNNTVLRSTITEAEGAWFSVLWKEVPFQDASASIDSGAIDAAFVTEPYLTAAVNEGKRVLSNSYSEFHPELDVNAYFTSNRWAEDNPELYTKFMTALKTSINYASEKPSKVRSVTTSFSESQWNVRALIALPQYRTSFNRAAVEELADAALEYDIIASQPDLDALLP